MRRVVITGLGLVTPVGCGVEASWANLLSSTSGARRVAEFDVSDITCQIACFVPRGALAEGKFSPDDWMEPKEQRKVDDFIIYAVALEPAFFCSKANRQSANVRLRGAIIPRNSVACAAS